MTQARKIDDGSPMIDDGKEAPSSNLRHPSSILNTINTPADLKPLSDADLHTLADELRGATIQAVSKTGGHLGAGLGVVELTTAIHAVFDTPHDRLIWDVGHQCYPHKILTGRKDRINTIRQPGGISGFTKRSESEYDPFGAGHSSTSISAALGMAVARDLNDKRHPGEGRGLPDKQQEDPGLRRGDDKEDNHVIAVIGDGAMSAGMAYEAMNNAGANKSKLIVILNDNEMSIAPPVGAMSRYLTRLVSSKPYINAREIGKKITDKLPPPIKGPIRHAAKRSEEGIRLSLSNKVASKMGGGSLFEEMGFYYIGPVDGHDMDQLLAVLRNAKETLSDSNHDGPIFIHALTQKGKGYAPAEASPSKMHGVKKFDVITGDQVKSAPGAPSYTNVFAKQLIAEAEKDERITAITAAMPDGTGLDKFAEKFPDRTFDVGIAEQHAVTFAAGMATEGFKPFVAIYSTFLQRAYDQIVHDVAIQNLPVRFMIDRAGLVGADGATHAGSFDIAYLGCLPNMTLMAASSIEELQAMVTFAANHNNGPIALRYPRGEGISEASLKSLNNAPRSKAQLCSPLQLGKGRIAHTTHPALSSCGLTAGSHATEKGPAIKSQDDDNTIAILSYGTRLEECLKAASKLEANGKTVTIADARFAKPLDKDLIKTLVTCNSQLVTIEEGSNAGFGAFVLEYLHNEYAPTTGHPLPVIRTLTLPDTFQDHDDPKKQYETAGLTAQHIVKSIIK